MCIQVVSWILTSCVNLSRDLVRLFFISRFIVFRFCRSQTVIALPKLTHVL